MPCFARWVLLIGGAMSLSCSAPTLEQRRSVAFPAMTALRDGSFDQADKRAREQIDADGANPYARLVRAIVRYKKSMHQLSLDVRTVVIGAGGFNHKYLRATLEEGEASLAEVESDLAAASVDPTLAVELCVACWEIDWNGNGRIDRGDRLLFQIEEDAEGKPLPDGDPRRKPTFRFDVGDVAWARAFVSFQRAALDVALAYDVSDVDGILAGDKRRTLVLRLAHADRIADAKQRILEALDRSDEARRAYLAETDDDREWVPNPRQLSHPIPLAVDQGLYDTWEGVLGDLRRLVRGEEGLLVADLLALGDQRVERTPKGYLDIGGMLAHPHDITLSARDLERLDRRGDIGAMMSALFGDHYVATMKPSPLPRRLLRMKGEIDRREEGLERKLRYLFWLN